jgi:CBS domain containing-hemolysin-like protein
MLILTFTNAAAASMRNKIALELKEFVKGDKVTEDERKTIQEQLKYIQNADIVTFDSFNNSLVKKYFYRIPGFRKDFSILTGGVLNQVLYDIIDDMTREGTLNEEQGDLISSAIQFRDVEVGSILTSRMDLAAIDVSASQEEILKTIKEVNHSRMPVYEGTIDHIIGILQIRKYIKTYLAEGEIKDIRPLLDKPYFIYQTAKIDDLLRAMSREKLNIAVVTDDYGGTLGIISVEDILEELVGEIWDEEDDAEENIIEMNDGTYSVNAESLVTSVLDELGIDYGEEEEEELTNKRMSELAFEAFSEIPKEGDSFIFLNTMITVQMMDQNRIVRLKVKILSDKEEA